MTGAPGGVPRPYPGDVAPDAADAEFWAACRDGRYLIMRCGTCGLAVWPAGACPRHGAAAMAWTDASGRGTLVTWTVVHQRYATSFDGAPPNVALVELDEGPLVHASVLGTDRLEIGMRLEAVFEEIGPDVTVPAFRPARDDPRASLAG
ncbi:Zn-ribbon domain-containing OB-fold protein [Actinomadura sp. CNU-125]|uniref:Zn-ribbon domain-containing OB-fold protein n=1 Tax=Actinomadura sp. CNU-125 TaxID=1904961 RepID=UPI0009FA385E|nr:OB-fold domain-containing protein [Actinomadura sp. CNU-125]